MTTESTTRRFDIALSFPGEHRDYVKQVAAHLAKIYTEERILYDKYHDAEFARLDLNTYLPALYRKDSELIVIFLCPEYIEKLWCRLEWRHINQLIATVDAKRIMFFSFGNPGDLSEIGILGGDGYIDLTAFKPNKAADKIIKRINLNQGITPPQPTSTTPIDISRIIKYAPAELIGRESETQVLNDAWNKAVKDESKRPHILTFVALGGEGKTSLVAKWVAELAHGNWQGCDAAFAWSFYSQGTKDQTAASSELFLNEALKFFGDSEAALSNMSGFDKGKRLAQRVGEKRTLLILDGVEPLQYSPTSPMPGELKDQGLAALLKGLAASSQGLCVVTTRYSIADLQGCKNGTAPEHKLERLSTKAGVALLKSLGVTGNQNEYEALVEDVKGHALTLNLLGGFLKRAYHGDIRQRDRIKFEKADAKIQGGHAFRTMEAYENWLLVGGEEGLREVAILRLMGLFDRPAPENCIHALLKAPVIQNLTEALIGIENDDWEFSLTSLETANLLTVNRNQTGNWVSIDAHPLLREYFAKRLREKQPEAWQAAHQRLFEHLCETTKEGDQPSLEDLQPLYQAVSHGCLAGMQQQACDEVYYDRIQRGGEFYSTRKLGAFGSDLGAVACFYDQPWSRVSPLLKESDQAWLLNETFIQLRALGRLTEAVEPMRVTMEINVKNRQWKNAAVCASNLSELELTLGDLGNAVQDAGQSVIYADRSEDEFQRMGKRTTHADALHQSGRLDEALAMFIEAEKIQKKRQPDYPLLYSLPGFRYCDLLLTSAEREAWRTLECGGMTPPSAVKQRGDASTHSTTLRAIAERATQTLEWVTGKLGLLNEALDHLTLARAALYHSLLSGEITEQQTANLQLETALSGLRRAGQSDYLPRALLTRAWYLALTGHHTGHDSAQANLDETWEIAERGPMPLFLADIHLHRARLFCNITPYPWQSPQTDLAEARRLIEKHGYLRRMAELEEAEQAGSS